MALGGLVALVGDKLRNLFACRECNRLEALVLSERNRGNDLLGLLNQANFQLEVEREHSKLLEDRFLNSIGAAPRSEVRVSVHTDMKPFGGVERLGTKITRLQEASKEKLKKRLAEEEKKINNG